MFLLKSQVPCSILNPKFRKLSAHSLYSEIYGMNTNSHLEELGRTQREGDMARNGYNMLLWKYNSVIVSLLLLLNIVQCE